MEQIAITINVTLTEWYPIYTNPVKIGVYQTCGSEGECLKVSYHGYQYWDGERWMYFCHDSDSAYMKRHDQSLYQENYWRGITQNLDTNDMEES
jgi:hypothetical protein